MYTLYYYFLSKILEINDAKSYFIYFNLEKQNKKLYLL